MSEQSSLRRWSFSSLEVFLGIATLVLTQYLLHTWANRHAVNPNLVNQISFTGTIMSIVLAVLAIVYSYYQNATQQQVSHNVAAQVDLLQGVVTDVRGAKQSLAGELGRLDDIRENLEETLRYTRESHGRVSRIEEAFQRLSSWGSKEDTNREGNEIVLDAPEKAWLVRRAALLDVQFSAYYLLMHPEAQGKQIADLAFDVYAPAVAEFEGLKGASMLASIGGHFMGVYYVLDDLGLISKSYNTPQRKCDREFQQLVMDLASEKRHEPESALLNLIDRSLDGNSDGSSE
jgi:hypothetical protein